jgi:hypothetical protein
VTFSVTCAAYTGAIEVVSTTTGADLDLDGYGLRVDGGLEYRMGTSDSVHIPRLLPGPHVLEITGVARNCSLAGAQSRQANVAVGDTSRVPFQISCARVDRISITRGFADEARVLIFRETGDFEADAGEGIDASWEPGGLTYVAHRATCYYYGYYCYGLGLFKVRASDWAATQIQAGEASQADWSPDGKHITFVNWDRGHTRLYVMEAVGTAGRELPLADPALAATDPDWSPDGSRIAFTCSTSLRADICVINADGTGFMRLTDDAFTYAHPAWSPDGTRLAFTTSRGAVTGPQIAVMNVDGTGFRGLWKGAEPAWSFDGTRIAFVDGPHGAGLYVTNAAGTTLVRLTTNSRDSAPAWRP